jgi:hypothetical protein
MFDWLLGLLTRSMKLTYWNKRQHKKPQIRHLSRGDEVKMTVDGTKLILSFERDGLHLTLIEKKTKELSTSPKE